MAPKLRLGRDFNLGGEQAEADPLLERAFYDFGVYKAAASRDDARCFLIGRTGSGKSAVMQRIEETAPEHVVRINPEDLSLPYLLDLGVVTYLSNLEVHLDPLFIALWKHVLLVELIKHRYNVDSPEAKSNFLNGLKDKIKRDPSKSAALEYLDEFGASFWCETDERVREITTTFERKIDLGASMSAAVPHFATVATSIAGSRNNTTEDRTEQKERFQRIVNETQLPRLNKMIGVLGEEILDSPQHFTYVLIDDLDRDWVDEKIANDLIRCLFRAALDLLRVKNLKIIIGLRTNILEHLNFGSRTGGQEEKFRSLALQVHWTKKELLALADERARVASEMVGHSEIQGIRTLLPTKSQKWGDPFDFLLDRTLMRPRDLIAFCNECITVGTGRSRLTWGDLHKAEANYSKNRLLALRDEWKPTFPGIDAVFRVFEGSSREIDVVSMTVRLDEAVLLLADPAFPGVSWMTQMSEPVWDGSDSDDFRDTYQPLVKLLYDIGLIGIKHGGAAPAYSSNSPGLADHPSALGGLTTFVIHPAFRPALAIVGSDRYDADSSLQSEGA